MDHSRGTDTPSEEYDLYSKHQKKPSKTPAMDHSRGSDTPDEEYDLFSHKKHSKEHSPSKAGAIAPHLGEQGLHLIQMSLQAEEQQGESPVAYKPLRHSVAVDKKVDK